MFWQIDVISFIVISERLVCQWQGLDIKTHLFTLLDQHVWVSLRPGRNTTNKDSLWKVF